MNSNQRALMALKKINKMVQGSGDHQDLFLYWHFRQDFLWQDICASVNEVRFHGYRCVGFLKRIFVFFWSFLFALIMAICIRLTRDRILVYSIYKNHTVFDQRIGGVFDYLNTHKKRYFLALHGVWNRAFFHTLWQAGPFLNMNIFFERPSDSDHPLLKKARSFFEQSFNDDVRPLVLKHATLSFASPRKVFFYTMILKLAGVRLVLAIDDARYCQELIVAAQSLAIKTIVFQHGRYNEYMVGWMGYELSPNRCTVPDYLVVWNEYWKNRLLSLSRPFYVHKDRIIIGGAPTRRASTSIAPSLPSKSSKHTQACILFVYETKAVPHEISDYISRILDVDIFRIVFKLRSDELYDNQVNRFKLRRFLSHPNFKIVTDFSDDDWQNVDLVIGTYSTLLYSVIERGIPVAVLQSSSTEAYDLVEEHLASYIDGSKDSLKDQIEKALAVDYHELERRKSRLAIDCVFEETLSSLIP